MEGRVDGLGSIDVDRSDSGSGSSSIVEEEERTFEFLTSTFGGVLPIDNHNNDHSNNHSNDSSRTHVRPKGLLSFSITTAMPHEDACSPIASVLPPPAQGTRARATAQGTRAIVAVLVVRGKCSFDVKAFHVQQAGGSLMIVVDPNDGPLQRLGGTFPLAGHVGIPR